jgi:hypothetical protein
VLHVRLPHCAFSSFILFLTQHFQGFGHVGQEELSQRFEHSAESRVSHAVENLIAGFACLDDVLVTQNGEMLGGVGLLDANFGTELADGQLTVREVLDKGNSRGMRQRLKDSSFVSPHGF